MRRAILDALGRCGPSSLIELRRELPEQPAAAVVGYHLGVLEEADLVLSEAEGSERTFTLVL